ncbi:hypothetical protein VNO77_03821 [Canavalia gladiata]|uniref:Uncharacterized protein n=1 Tax=Canavalia gladiata TaxID=3824 RepID=A0AAN9MVE8_CANGL
MRGQSSSSVHALESMDEVLRLPASSRSFHGGMTSLATVHISNTSNGRVTLLLNPRSALGPVLVRTLFICMGLSSPYVGWRESPLHFVRAHLGHGLLAGVGCYGHELRACWDSNGRPSGGTYDLLHLLLLGIAITFLVLLSNGWKRSCQLASDSAHLRRCCYVRLVKPAGYILYPSRAVVSLLQQRCRPWE